MLKGQQIKILFITFTLLALIFNIREIYFYLIETVYFLVFEVDVWTYVLLALAVFVSMVYSCRRYFAIKEEITRLSYVNYISEDDFDRMREETTREAITKLQRSSKYLEVKQRIERGKGNRNPLSPPLSDEDEIDSISKD